MQLAFYENLARGGPGGVWYPPDRIDPIEKKHQFLIPPLVDGDLAALEREFETFAQTAPPGTHTVLLSTEGLFNHWPDFPNASKAMLERLALNAAIEVWVTFREPLDYAIALYAQCLRNPSEFAGVYGSDVDFETMLDDPQFVRRLDYLGFVEAVNALLGAGHVRVFRYGADIVARYFRALGVRPPLRSVGEVNTSLREPGIDIIRVVNRYDLAGDAKRAAADLVLRLDTLIGERGRKFVANSASEARIRELTEDGWREIQPMFASETTR